MGDARGVPVLIVGVIHGREEAGLQVTDILQTMTPPAGVQWWIVPSMNPDGLALNVRGNAAMIKDPEAAAAYRAAGPVAVQGFRTVLEAMMDPEMRRQYQSLREGEK